MNRKERRLALCTALMSRIADILVVQNLQEHLPQPKTRELTAALQRWGVAAGEKVLLIVAERYESVFLSARNVPTIRLIAANQLNVFDILHADKIVITESAIALIHEVYGDDTATATTNTEEVHHG
jgi:large subunit ribosomal protein L4